MGKCRDDPEREPGAIPGSNKRRTAGRQIMSGNERGYVAQGTSTQVHTGDRLLRLTMKLSPLPRLGSELEALRRLYCSRVRAARAG